MRVQPFDINKTTNGRFRWISDARADPVFVEIEMEVFYFYDEFWNEKHGPFETEEECRVALVKYAQNL
jgi:hypothetical protein